MTEYHLALYGNGVEDSIHTEELVCQMTLQLLRAADVDNFRSFFYPTTSVLLTLILIRKMMLQHKTDTNPASGFIK